MKRFLALGLALVLILSGCSSRRPFKVKDNQKIKSTISTSNKGAESGSNQNVGTSTIKTDAVKGTPEKADKLQNDAEQTAAEIDKIMDSLNDIDESKLDY